MVDKMAQPATSWLYVLVHKLNMHGLQHSFTCSGETLETSSSCRKELVGEYIGDGEKHTCSFSHEGEEPEYLSLMGGGGERG